MATTCTEYPGGSVSAFDQLATSLASGVSRRDALKLVVGGVVGTMLTTLGVRKAHAKSKCNNPGVCESYVSCQGETCVCGTTPKTAKTGKGFCFDGETSCEGAVACTSNGQCKAVLGKGWKCILNNCCEGEVGAGGCAPKCGSLSSSGRRPGRTFAG
jgi:hypothetical protein